MSWPRWTREKVREFLIAAIGGPWPQMQQQASRLLEELPDEQPRGFGLRSSAAPRPRTGVDKSGLPFAPPTHPTQRDRRVARNEGMSELRRAVLARARRRCEFCGIAEPTDAHHVLGGSSRTELESEYTLAAICGEKDDPASCHGRCNASPAWAREQGLAWARRMGKAARAAIAAGDPSPKHIADAAGFAHTAELLEGRIALANAQAVPTTRS